MIFNDVLIETLIVGFRMYETRMNEIESKILNIETRMR
jgi:hypothetical protein